METARIYVNNTATSLEVSKEKTADLQRSMKISGRVEGTAAYLAEVCGLEIWNWPIMTAEPIWASAGKKERWSIWRNEGRQESGLKSYMKTAYFKAMDM